MYVLLTTIGSPEVVELSTRRREAEKLAVAMFNEHNLEGNAKSLDEVHEMLAPMDWFDVVKLKKRNNG